MEVSEKKLLKSNLFRVINQSILETSLVALTNRSYERAPGLEVELMKNMVTLLDTIFEVRIQIQIISYE